MKNNSDNINPLMSMNYNNLIRIVVMSLYWFTWMNWEWLTSQKKPHSNALKSQKHASQFPIIDLTTFNLKLLYVL